MESTPGNSASSRTGSVTNWNSSDSEEALRFREGCEGSDFDSLTRAVLLKKSNSSAIQTRMGIFVSMSAFTKPSLNLHFTKFKLFRRFEYEIIRPRCLQRFGTLIAIAECGHPLLEMTDQGTVVTKMKGMYAHHEPCLSYRCTKNEKCTMKKSDTDPQM